MYEHSGGVGHHAGNILIECVEDVVEVPQLVSFEGVEDPSDVRRYDAVEQLHGEEGHLGRKLGHLECLEIIEQFEGLHVLGGNVLADDDILERDGQFLEVEDEVVEFLGELLLNEESLAIDVGETDLGGVELAIELEDEEGDPFVLLALERKVGELVGVVGLEGKELDVSPVLVAFLVDLLKVVGDRVGGGEQASRGDRVLGLEVLHVGFLGGEREWLRVLGGGAQEGLQVVAGVDVGLEGSEQVCFQFGVQFLLVLLVLDQILVHQQAVQGGGVVLLHGGILNLGQVENKGVLVTGQVVLA